MKPIQHSIFALSAVAFAAALSVACGGHGDEASAGTLPAAAQTDADDQADTAALDATGHAYARADRDARAKGLPSLYGTAETLSKTLAPAPIAKSDRYPGVVQSNLVASTGAYGAPMIEPALKNAWGIAIRPAGFGGHFWVGAANTGLSIQYVGDVGDQPLFQDELKIVETGGAVSGVAFNPGTGFTITQQHPNGAITAGTKFFFANLTGTVTAWTERKRADGGFDHPADSAVVVDGTTRGSSFSGVAVSPDGDRMYAADFGADAQVRTYGHAFDEQAPLANPFRPPAGAQPGGFEAFNVQTIDRSTFVMYGRHVPPGTSPLPAEGRLAEFDDQGRFVARWHGRGFLNYPWGVAKAPENYGLYAGCLIVGNFGDGTLVAFHPRYRVALDYVRDARGQKVVIDGLWGLQFGNGASLGEADHMYFAAGPEKETQGLFGKLQANPNTLPLLAGVSLCR